MTVEVKEVDVEVTNQPTPTTETAKESNEAEDTSEIDNDPMIVSLREAEAEIAKEQPEGQPEADKAEAQPAKEPQPKPETDGKMPMVPKARLDEVLSENSTLKTQLTYVQGIAEARGEMLKSKPADTTGKPEEPGKTETVPEQTDYAGQIAKAEEEKIALAQKYEDGEISLVELRKQEIELDRQIRAAEDQREQARFNEANKVATDTVAASNRANAVTAEAIKIQEQHPYIAEIDALPEKIREGIWAQITDEAAANLMKQGINPADGKVESHLALIQEKARLTNEYGPRYTGKQLNTDPNSQKADQLSDKGKQRLAKLNLADQQPPTLNGTGAHANDGELTEADLEGMSQDQMADYLATAPGRVLKAAGLTNR